MAGRKNFKVRMPNSLLPKPKKILQRGLYEMMWCCKNDNYKPRDYSKRGLAALAASKH